MKGNIANDFIECSKALEAARRLIDRLYGTLRERNDQLATLREEHEALTKRIGELKRSLHSAEQDRDDAREAVRRLLEDK